MPQSITSILQRLEHVADYHGAWTALEDEGPILRERLRELRERETRLDDLLVVALVGGSGVGKSTLLNALAGDELAKTSEYRPCTSVPTVYHPPGAELDFSSDWHSVSGSALEHLVIVDTPDSDTIVREHRRIVVDVLAECDLILICADSEKYLDEATWSLLRPLKAERTFVCIETKANQAGSVKEHWLQRLEENSLKVADYFRVNSRRSLDRKLAGKPPGADEYDFKQLERFLQHELTHERIRRIKRSNAAGLLSKTLTSLEERIGAQESKLRELYKALDTADTDISKDCFEVVSTRLFAESHLWTFALGREVSLRAKGVVGTLFRLLEGIRTLPARAAAWTFLPVKSGAGHRAASLLADKELLEDEVDLASETLQNHYDQKRSELRLAFARAGFDAPVDGEGFNRFSKALGDRIARVLRGPARDRVLVRARLLTSWPVAILFDLAPLLFVAVSGYNIVTSYFSGDIYGAGFFVHAGTVLAILLAVELFVMSLLVRGFAWSARQSAVSDLRIALFGYRLAFHEERETLSEAEEMAGEIKALRQDVLGSLDDAEGD